MRKLTRVLPRADARSDQALGLTLAYEDRRRSRLRTRLDDGTEVALLVPRGTVLRDGDCLAGDDDPTLVRVRAAAETLSVARTSDAHLLSRAAYHLGNRHVPLQLTPGQLSYQHDHVLDGLVRDLGLDVDIQTGPFEPEAGGYRHDGTAGHGHAHEHAHAHDHAVAHEHGHEHPHTTARPHGADAPHPHSHAPGDQPRHGHGHGSEDD